ncbi:hypothetical protein D9M72_412130 [compost metagenome]
MHTQEGGDGGVRTRGFGMQDAGEQVGVALAPDGADQVDLGQLRDQVHRELGPVPAIDGDRLDLTVQELADLGQPVAFLAAEQLLEREEVAVGVRQVIDVDCSFGHVVPSRVISSDQKTRASPRRVKLLMSNIPQRSVAGKRTKGLARPARQTKKSRGRCLNIGHGSLDGAQSAYAPGSASRSL